jgi:hypothetical protein
MRVGYLFFVDEDVALEGAGEVDVDGRDIVEGEGTDRMG